ncbi:hypothetical protein F5Y16DRAFT_413163 [Xylariaceae sp. FL0255]|nr:hypothetical protein F5Y16DRAFT_413163 [Xylariaceae sp. FL0255]
MAHISGDSRTRNAISWPFLAAELRLQILEAIVEQKHRSWASLASVCKEWQYLIGNTSNDSKSGHRSAYQVTFQESFLLLFAILSTWEPTHQLTLEVDAESPSDKEHFFEEWSTLYRDLMPLFAEFSPHLKFAELPSIHVVRCLLVRRQVRRRFGPGDLEGIIEKLEGLEHYIFEPWRVCILNSNEQPLLDFCSPHNSKIQSLRRRLPKTVKRLTIFEDFNEELAMLLSTIPPHVEHEMRSQAFDTVRIVDPQTSEAFAFKCIDLKELSVSYMVNAEQFLGACEKTWCWQHLQYLTLASQLLQPTEDRRAINTLLCDARITALQMPKLHTLVLYTDVIGAWQQVASRFHVHDLRVHEETIKDKIRSHGDAIYYLKLPTQVVDPASLWQIRREGLISIT